MNDRMRLMTLVAVPVLTLVLYAVMSMLYGAQNALWAAGMFLAALDRVLGILVFLPRWASWAVILFFLTTGARFVLWENERVSEGQRMAVAVAALILLLLAALIPPLLGAGRGPERGVWWRMDTYRAAGTERVLDGIPFVWVPAGHYIMGSLDTESGRNVDEGRREVVLPRGFWVSRREVTLSEYLRVMGKVPESMTNPPANQELPVTGVSYEEARAFTEKLAGTGKGTFRLPKEIEWEYACRAGTTTPWSFGGDAAQLPEHAWFGANSGKEPHPVGTRKPNPWGICDMHGNAAEWCLESAESGREAAYRVYRGGNYDADASQCRSAARGIFLPSQAHPPQSVGIRVVREP